MENYARKMVKEVWDLPYDDGERLDRAYLAGAYVGKRLRVELTNGSIETIDTFDNRTIIMQCGSREEAFRYLKLVNRYFKKKRAWIFKFLYPGGYVVEQPSEQLGHP